MNDRGRLGWALLILVFCGLFYLPRLGSLPFYTKGEPREAVQVWEEVHSGEWILPRRNGTEIPSKPPLFHWLGGVSALVTGEADEFSIRFPSALLATLSVLGIFAMGAARWGVAAGVYAAFMLATNFEWVRAATSARVDMTLAACLTAAFIALDRVLDEERPSRLALVAFYVAMGLAALAKGPVGIILPGLLVAVRMLIRRDWGCLRRLYVVPGGMLAVAIAGVWYAAAIWQGGHSFVYKQLLVENLGRFVDAEDSGAGHVHGPLYLLAGFFTNFAPWSFFLIPLAPWLWARRARLAELGYLNPLLWFAVIVGFYSISAGKRTVYVLPAYPAAALLLGAWWSEVSESTAGVPRAIAVGFRAASVLIATLMLGAAALLLVEASGSPILHRLAPHLHEKDAANLPILRELVSECLPALLAWIAVIVPAVGVLTYGAWRDRWRAAFGALVVVLATTLVLVTGVFQPELARRHGFKPFVDEIREKVAPEDRLSFFQTFDYGVVFYARRHVPVLENDFGEPAAPGRNAYLLIWESRWRSLTPADQARLEVIDRSEGTGPKGQDRLVFALVLPAAS